MSVEKNVPEIRFKGFSGEWDKKILGDLVQLENVLDKFDKSNLSKDEVKDFEFWRKQSKAKLTSTA